MCGKKIAQKMFIFPQFLEKIAQKQNVPKFWKNLPNFQKLPNTCSPATVPLDPFYSQVSATGLNIVTTVVDNHQIENNRPTVGHLCVCRQLCAEETRRIYSEI